MSTLDEILPESKKYIYKKMKQPGKGEMVKKNLQRQSARLGILASL